MAEEYLKLLDEARKKFARGEDASDLVPKLTEAIAKMTKEAREAALKSPGLTPDEANTELGVLWLEATIAWAVAEALALVGSYIPFTNAAPALVKALDAPELKWRVDAAMQGIALKTEARLLKPLMRYYNQQYLPNIVDVGTIVQLYRRGFYTEEDYNKSLALWGYSADEAAGFAVAAITQFSVGEAARAVWRGLRNAAWQKAHVKNLGYHPDDIDKIIALQEPIPGSGDLINFVVKEVFPISALPDAPSEFVSWMAKQGYSADWCKAYWYAHWRLVPEGSVLDLWHRGYITTDEATKYLVLHDFPTFKRPGQTKTDTEMVLENSYSLLPRIDLRFGWFTGTLTEDEMKALYAKYGFKSEDAVKEITIQKARVLEIYRRDYLSTLRLAYRRGKITADAFRSKVVAEKFPAEVADWLIKSEDLRVSLGAGVEASNEERALTKSDLIRLYRRGLIDQARLKSELVNMNYSAAEIALLIADADYIAPIESREVMKIVSLSDLETLYKRALRKRDDIIRDLKYRGYTDVDVSLLLQIWDAELAEKAAAEKEVAAKAAAPIRRGFTLSELEDAYKKGLIGRGFVTTSLQEMNFVPFYIDTTLKNWDMPPGPAGISPSEALDAFTRGLRDESWTRSYLRGNNYTEPRINLLIEAAKAKIAEAAAVTPIKPHIYTQAELFDLYEHGVHDEGSLKAGLKALNYTDASIYEQILLIKAKQAKPVAKPKEFSLSELQFTWENGLITDTSLINRIGEMGYSAEDAALMVQLTKAHALENERNRLLSITESRFKMGLGTEAEARAFMSSLGYITERQDIIIGAWTMERDLGIATDTRDAWLKAYSKGQSRESVYGYLTEVLKLDKEVVNALLLLEDAKLLKAG